MARVLTERAKAVILIDISSSSSSSSSSSDSGKVRSAEATPASQAQAEEVTSSNSVLISSPAVIMDNIMQTRSLPSP